MITRFRSLLISGWLAAAAIGPATAPALATPRIAGTGVTDPLLVPATAKVVKAAIAAHRGKVVMVNFWATWCKPCVAELPALAHLQRVEGARNFSLILVSGDEPGSGPQVKRVLATHQHHFSYLLRPGLEAFFTAFDPKFQDAIALPRSYIYNRQGRMVASFSGDHTAAEYQKLLKPYL